MNRQVARKDRMYDNTPVQNSRYTQTRPYVGWTKCPRCERDALVIGYLHSFGECSTCGVWSSTDIFHRDQKPEVGFCDGADRIITGPRKSADSNFPKTCKFCGHTDSWDGCWCEYCSRCGECGGTSEDVTLKGVPHCPHTQYDCMDYA